MSSTTNVKIVGTIEEAPAEHYNEVGVEVITNCVRYGKVKIVKTATRKLVTKKKKCVLLTSTGRQVVSDDNCGKQGCPSRGDDELAVFVLKSPCE